MIKVEKKEQFRSYEINARILKGQYNRVKKMAEYLGVSHSELVRLVINKHYEEFKKNHIVKLDTEEVIPVNPPNVVGAKLTRKEYDKVKELARYYKISYSTLLRVLLREYFKVCFKDKEAKLPVEVKEVNTDEDIHLNKRIFLILDKHYHNLVSDVFLTGYDFILVKVNKNNLISLLETDFIPFTKKRFNLSLNNIYPVADIVYFEFKQ